MSEPVSGTPVRTANVRLMTLLIVLILAVLALVYDYKIARVAVESVYDKVASMNESINVSAEGRSMTSEDVQKVLGKPPISVTQHNSYTVETYGFTSGIPLRNHKYFAVYTTGIGKSEGKLIFSKQFKFHVPEEELLIP